MAHCWRRKYYISFNTGRPINATLACSEFYSWAVSDVCCYDEFDRLDKNPYCCHSEIYKLITNLATICGTILGVACFLFICWYANITHHLLRIITCGRFNLNEFLQKRKLRGPYVDPSFYSGEPFWTPGGSEMYPYPLRPMPPRIFYPAHPSSYKGLGRWSGSSTRLPHGQMPLFVLASRQFTRKPWSARPNERRTPSSASSPPPGCHDSRRSSTTSTSLDLHNSQRIPSFSFRVHIDEVEAAAELLESLKNMDEKGDKAFTIPRLMEETDLDLDLENGFMTNNVEDRLGLGRMTEYRGLSASTRTSTADLSEDLSQVNPSSTTSSDRRNRKSALPNTLNYIDSNGSYALTSLFEENYRDPPLITYPEEDTEIKTDMNIPGFIPDETEISTSNIKQVK